MKRTWVSSVPMTPPALAATIMEGTPVTKMPIATPVRSVAGCSAALTVQAARGAQVRGGRRPVR